MAVTMKEKDYRVAQLRKDILDKQKELMLDDFGKEWESRIKKEAVDLFLQESGLSVLYKEYNRVSAELDALNNKMQELRAVKDNILNAGWRKLGVQIHGYNLFYYIENEKRTKELQESIIRKSKNGQKYYELQKVLDGVEREIMFANTTKAMQEIVQQLLDKLNKITGE